MVCAYSEKEFTILILDFSLSDETEKSDKVEMSLLSLVCPDRILHLWI